MDNWIRFQPDNSRNHPVSLPDERIVRLARFLSWAR
jgi:hypothetical protein